MSERDLGYNPNDANEMDTIESILKSIAVTPGRPEGQEKIDLISRVRVDAEKAKELARLRKKIDPLKIRKAIAYVDAQVPNPEDMGVESFKLTRDALERELLLAEAAQSRSLRHKISLPGLLSSKQLAGAGQSFVRNFGCLLIIGGLGTGASMTIGSMVSAGISSQQAQNIESQLIQDPRYIEYLNRRSWSSELDSASKSVESDRANCNIEKGVRGDLRKLQTVIDKENSIIQPLAEVEGLLPDGACANMSQIEKADRRGKLLKIKGEVDRQAQSYKEQISLFQEKEKFDANGWESAKIGLSGIGIVGLTFIVGFACLPSQTRYEIMNA